MKKTLLIHPLLFGIYPILFLYGKNVDEVLFSETMGLLALAAGLALALLIAFRFVLGSGQRAAVVTSALLILFFSAGHFHSFLHGHDIFVAGIQPLFRHLIWAVCLFALPFLLVVGAVLRYTKEPYRLNHFLNIFSLALVVLALFPVFQYQLTLWRNQSQFQDLEPTPITSVQSHNADRYPDIYYIILDGYGNLDSIRDFYGYSCEEFLDQLRERGFFIATQSRSNYFFTIHSLSSSLNFDYLKNLKRYNPRQRIPDSSWCRRLIQTNQAWQRLKSQEYRYFHFGPSGFPPTTHNPYADVNLSPEQLGEFPRMLLRTTVLGPAEPVLTAADLRQSILYVFDRLKEVPKVEEPTFSFVHFAIPHPPYVFDREGNAYSFAQLVIQEGMKKKEYYVEQLIFTNKKLIELIDTLMLNSSIPPVIVMQGDHGPRPEWRGSKSEWVDRSDEDAFQDYLKETMGIFNAYHLPGGGDKLLYPSITPVNTFRVILNHYFNQSYKLLDDESYIPTADGSTFQNVTANLAAASKE